LLKITAKTALNLIEINTKSEWETFKPFLLPFAVNKKDIFTNLNNKMITFKLATKAFYNISFL